MTVLTTTTAATQAGVTVATIRTWCRRNAIAATKTAGRWIIDATSLARRITIGTRRNRMTEPAPHTMAARGTDYVTAWPGNIARQTHLSPEYIAEALTRAGLTTEDAAVELRGPLLRGEHLAAIANLTPEQAKAVVAEMKAIRTEIREAAKTHCHYCGLELSKTGECPSCGDGEY
jgi:DNA-binding transcriptional MerR regulator